jgi:hypothetical protein
VNRSFAFSATALALWVGAVAFADDSPVARWRGGELGLERFAVAYDPDGEARARGGDDLRVALAKAVYLEILTNAARAAGLDRDPRFLARLEEAQQQRLDRADALLDLTPPTDAELALAAESLPRRTEVDFDLVLQRCSLAPAVRAGCLDHTAQLELSLRTTADLGTLNSETTLAGTFEAVDLATIDPFLAQALETAQVDVPLPVELVAGPAVVRLRARRELPQLATARAQLLEQQRSAAIAALRSEHPQLAGLSDEALLLEVFPNLRVALRPDRTGPAEWALADFAFEVLPDFAGTPAAADRDAARAELMTYRVELFRLTGPTALRQAGALHDALRGEKRAQSLAELVAAMAPDAEKASIQLDARTVNRLPEPIRRGGGPWGPLTLQPKHASVLGLEWTRSALVVGETSPGPAPTEAEGLERARRRLRSRIGGGVDTWQAEFGARFEVELLLALDPAIVPFDQPQRSTSIP